MELILQPSDLMDIRDNLYFQKDVNFESFTPETQKFICLAFQAGISAVYKPNSLGRKTISPEEHIKKQLKKKCKNVIKPSLFVNSNGAIIDIRY